MTMVMLVIVVGYYTGLCALTNQAVSELNGIQQQYQTAEAVANFKR